MDGAGQDRGSAGRWLMVNGTVHALPKVDRDGVILDARIALGGVATRPWRAWEAEAALRGRHAEAAAFAHVAELAMRGAVPQSQNGFKIGLARQVLAQTLAGLAEMPA